MLLNESESSEPELSDICESSCYIMLTQRPFALGQEVHAAAAALSYDVPPSSAASQQLPGQLLSSGVSAIEMAGKAHFTWECVCRFWQTSFGGFDVCDVIYLPPQ